MGCISSWVTLVGVIIVLHSHHRIAGQEPSAERDVPIRGDRELLRVIHDGLVQAESEYRRGSLVAEIHDEWAVGQHSHSTITAVWDNGSVYWEAGYHLETAKDPMACDYFRPDQPLSDDDIEIEEHRIIRIETPRMTCAYFPSDRPTATIRIPPERPTLTPIFQFHPARVWMTRDRHIGSPWRNFFGPPIGWAPLEIVIRNEGGDRVVVDRRYDADARFVTCVSLAKGARVVEYEVKPRRTSPEEPRKRAYTSGTFAWEQLDSGTWVVRETEQKHTYPDKDGIVLGSYRMKLLDYDPSPEIPNNRFDISSLQFPAGTRVTEVRGVPPNGQTRTYRVGEDAGLPQALLDRLAKELDESGFAKPKEAD